MEEKTKRLRETGMPVKIYHERLKSPLFHVLHRKAQGYLTCRAPRDAWGRGSSITKGSVVAPLQARAPGGRCHYRIGITNSYVNVRTPKQEARWKG